MIACITAIFLSWHLSIFQFPKLSSLWMMTTINCGSCYRLPIHRIMAVNVYETGNTVISDFVLTFHLLQTISNGFKVIVSCGFINKSRYYSSFISVHCCSLNQCLCITSNVGMSQRSQFSFLYFKTVYLTTLRGSLI